MDTIKESHVAEYERKLAHMVFEATVALKAQERALFGSPEADEAFETIQRIVQEAKDLGMASELYVAVAKGQK